MAAGLREVKNRTWFYEFELPDGSRTKTDIPPAVLAIHTSRRDKLRKIVEQHVDAASRGSAIDFASHEGWFSLELAKHFRKVTGYEIRDDSLAAARLVTEALGVKNVSYEKADLQSDALAGAEPADFLLLYGLLYHLEDPIRVLRLASRLARKHILIESQVMQVDLSGKIEDGHYQWQRDIQGNFALVADYSKQREGGSTDVALVPSVSALVFLLKAFGFAHVEVLAFEPGDYEQFVRRSRAIVYGRR